MQSRPKAAPNEKVSHRVTVSHRIASQCTFFLSASNSRCNTTCCSLRALRAARSSGVRLAPVAFFDSVSSCDGGWGQRRTIGKTENRKRKRRTSNASSRPTVLARLAAVHASYSSIQGSIWLMTGRRSMTVAASRRWPAARGDEEERENVTRREGRGRCGRRVHLGLRGPRKPGTAGSADPGEPRTCATWPDRALCWPARVRRGTKHIPQLAHAPRTGAARLSGARVTRTQL